MDVSHSLIDLTSLPIASSHSFILFITSILYIFIYIYIYIYSILRNLNTKFLLDLIWGFCFEYFIDEFMFFLFTGRYFLTHLKSEWLSRFYSRTYCININGFCSLIVSSVVHGTGLSFHNIFNLRWVFLLADRIGSLSLFLPTFMYLGITLLLWFKIAFGTKSQLVLFFHQWYLILLFSFYLCL